MTSRAVGGGFVDASARVKNGWSARARTSARTCGAASSTRSTTVSEQVSNNTRIGSPAVRALSRVRNVASAW
jgi:hypothetical protein